MLVAKLLESYHLQNDRIILKHEGCQGTEERQYALVQI
jgi:hypothetical protein